VLFRAAAALLVLVGVADAEPDEGLTATVAGGTNETGRAAVGGATKQGEHRFEVEGAYDTTEHADFDANITTYRGRWRLARERYYVDVLAFGDRQRLKLERPGALTAIPTDSRGLSARAGLQRFHAFGAEHEVLAGVGFVQASGETSDDLRRDTMLTHTPMVARSLHGEHRFMTAYIDDTVRFIRGIDVTTSVVVEQWRNLGGDSTITYGSGPSMESETPDVSSLLVSPSLGVVGHVTDKVSLVGRSYRSLRAPTLTELYRPSWLADGLTAANPELRAETVWTTELGPQLSVGSLDIRASAYVSEIDDPITSVTLDGTMEDGAVRQRRNIDHARVAGARGAMSWRPAKSWLASVGYTYARSTTDAGRELAQTPRHVTTALLTYDSASVATLTGAVRYVGTSYLDDRNTTRLGGYTVIDAIAVRKIHGRLSGFIGVDNLLDRRYLLGRGAVDTFGTERTFHLGVKIGMP
jgi:outer membrane receptor protein involved in Fe transport